MHYIIYIDKVWLIDFVTGTYLLFLTGQTYRLRCRPLRLLASAAAGATVFVGFLLLPGIGMTAGILFQALCAGPLLLKAAFSFRTKEMVVKTYTCINGYGLLLGGMILCLSGYLPGMRGNLKTGQILLISTAATCLISGYLYVRRRDRRRGRLYTVRLDFYGEVLTLKGFADSGNSLREPYGKRPVSVLDLQAAGDLVKRVPPEKHYLIPFHSIGKKHGLLRAVELPWMEVDDGEERRIFTKAVAALSEEVLTGKGGYQVILHPEFVRLEE
ncbi:MAG: hypothetical protein HFI11_00890 [Lachnospiraceae bacterium]|nr:hypothetical protein [Lachnospiraceae bacterium]